MQDIGSKQDKELGRENLTLSCRELSVECVGRVSACWKLDVFSARVHLHWNECRFFVLLLVYSDESPGRDRVEDV
jgi:hypothetical protein